VPTQGSLLLRNIGTLVTCDPAAGEGPLGVIFRAAVLCRGPRIAYVGPEDRLPSLGWDEPVTLDLDGQVVLPGLVDAHTHLVFAGDRLQDFSSRLAGDTYAAIAARGGGILSTVRATRAAPDEELRELAEARVEALATRGVTTIEVKSGYGLDTAHELRLLETVRAVGRRCVPDLVPTFLGAHSFPEEHRGSTEAKERYVDRVVAEMLPQVVQRGLARFCDVFVDEGVFSVPQGRRILEAARAMGLPVKVHAEQLRRTGAARLAAELSAVSAEHLEHATDEDLRALAEAGTVAVLLPGASFFLREPFVEAGRFREHGVRVALATDLNPGSSPTDNLLLMAQMGVLGCGMTVEEAILAITAHGAAALGLDGDRGRLTAGRRADLAFFRVRDPRELIYQLGAAPCVGLVKDGRYVRVEGSRLGTLRAES
jgi:imidazolonepropionase